MFPLQSLLTDEQIASAPVLILGNKIDIPGAGSEDEIRSVFGLHGHTTGKVGFCSNHLGRQTVAVLSDNVFHLNTLEPGN